MSTTESPDMPASGMMEPVAWIDRAALTLAEQRMRDAPISTVHVPLGNQSRSREMADPVALYAIPPDYTKRIAELEHECELSMATIADERAIVDRIWATLGIVSYEEAGGKEISDIVAHWMVRAEAAEAQLTALRSLVTEAASAIQTVLVARDKLAFASARETLSRLNEAVRP